MIWRDPQGKTDFYKEAAQKLLRFEDELERNNYIQAVAKTYEVSPEELRRMVNRLALRGTGIPEPVKPKSGRNRSQEKQDGFELSQKLMLTWMTSYPELFGENRSLYRTGGFYKAALSYGGKDVV